jgi:acetyltransferase-like isoleucine patch superfamily enzyme/acyl carrier protein
MTRKSPENTVSGALRSGGKHQHLDEREFIRQKIHGGSESAFRRYAGLVLARPTISGLLKYEFVNFFAGFPGALGLVIRRFLYPRILSQAGKGAVFGRFVTLRHGENIVLGDGVVLDDYCLVDARGAGEQGIHIGDRVIVNRNVYIQAKVGHISIGRDTNIGTFSQIVSQGPIEIGENVSIAGNVIIAGGRYQVETDDDGAEAKKRFTAGAIRIGSNVRLGIRSVILDGVTIGRNAIVAPGSVVMNDVDEGTVVMGSPARPLRRRDARAADHGKPLNDAGDFTGNMHRSPENLSGQEEAVRAAIRHYLEETHFADFDSKELNDSSSLFDHGIIDSAGVVGLVTMLEAEFDIQFDESDLLPDRLSTVDGLASLVLDSLRASQPGTVKADA